MGGKRGSTSTWSCFQQVLLPAREATLSSIVYNTKFGLMDLLAVRQILPTGCGSKEVGGEFGTPIHLLL
jgi:hypothetical protein